MFIFVLWERCDISEVPTKKQNSVTYTFFDEFSSSSVMLCAFSSSSSSEMVVSCDILRWTHNREERAPTGEQWTLRSTVEWLWLLREGTQVCLLNESNSNKQMSKCLQVYRSVSKCSELSLSHDTTAFFYRWLSHNLLAQSLPLIIPTVSRCRTSSFVAQIIV